MVLTVPALDPAAAAATDPRSAALELFGDGDSNPTFALAGELVAAVRRWSPLDGLPRQAAGRFPHVLLRVGLGDERVPVWEPARYLARLRHSLRATGAEEEAAAAEAKEEPVVALQVRQGGHFAFEGVEEDAWAGAFLLHFAGLWSTAGEAAG